MQKVKRRQEKMLEIKNLRKVFYEGQPEENIIFENLMTVNLLQ